MDVKKMKVLCYADRANFPGLLPAQRGKGGLPMSAWQITAAKQRLGSQQILLTRAFTEGGTVADVRIPPVRLRHYLPSFSNSTSFQNPKGETLSSPETFPPELFSLGAGQIPCRFLGNYFSKLIRYEKPSVIHIHQPRRSNMPIIRAAILSGVPAAVTLHGLGLADKEWPGWQQSERDRIFDTTMIEFINREGVAITCVGEVIREKILSLLQIKYPENVYFTRNGVDLNLFRLLPPADIAAIRKGFGIPEGTRVISSIGTLDRRKNFEFLVNSINTLRKNTRQDIRCWIIGEGHLRGRLTHLIKSLGLEGIVLLVGEKQPAEIAEILAASDAMALVSLSEAFSRTIFESTAVGTPAVSFKDLFSENFARNYAGGLVLADRGDPEQFADILDSVLQRKWDRNKVAKTAKDYSWNDVGEDYLNILSSVADRPKKPADPQTWMES